MDAAAKQQAADNQLNTFNAYLKSMGQVSGLDLSRYFQAASNGGNSGTYTSGNQATINPNSTQATTDYNRVE
jgi:hypothetical protein